MTDSPKGSGYSAYTVHVRTFNREDSRYRIRDMLPERDLNGSSSSFGVGKICYQNLFVLFPRPSASF